MNVPPTNTKEHTMELGTWVLVIFLVAQGNSSVAIEQIKGFSSELTCDAAKQAFPTLLDIDGRKSGFPTMTRTTCISVE